MKYVAFLRGINVGVKTKVSMEILKKALEMNGYSEIKTVLNSGNVIFESAKRSEELLKKHIEEIIEKIFGFHSDVIICSGDKIKQLVQLDPFKQVTITDNTRLYVTFLSKQPAITVSLPYVSVEKDFFILSVSKKDVCWYVTVSPTRGTTEAMKFLEKTFGKNITTRNWNTIQKISALLLL